MSIENAARHMTPVPLDDRQHAEHIRSLIAQLNGAVNKARDAGLSVELSLGALGSPTWNGYKDAAKIVRVL